MSESERGAIDKSSCRPDPRATVRYGACLAAASGVLLLANNYLPGAQVLNRGLLSAIGVAALVLAVVLGRVRREQTASRCTVLLPLVSLLLTAVANSLGHVSPYSYALFVVVTFVYIGLSQPPLVWLAYMPAAIAGYVVPLAISPDHSLEAGLPSVTVVLPVCGLVAEVIARSERSLCRARARQDGVLASLAGSESRYRSLVENVNEIVYAGTITSTGAGSAPRFSFVSPQVKDLLGYESADFLANPAKWGAVMHPEDCAAAMAATQLLLETRRAVTRTYRVRHGLTGDYRWMEDRVVPEIGDDGALTGFLGIAREVTAQKELEERLTHEAFHDQLTGLANRALFLERVERAVARGGRDGRPVAVLNIDLDDFKAVNDTLGHAGGDELLVAVAERLSAAVRPGDTVARFGGDEFVVLLEDLFRSAEAAAAAKRIVETLSHPFDVGGRSVLTRGSVGVAVAPAGAITVDQLMRDADVAMYEAKAAGKGLFRVARSAAVLSGSAAQG